MLTELIKRRITIHLIMMVLVLSAAFLYTPTPSAQARLDLSKGLLVSNRDRFRLCFNLSPALTSATSTIREKLSRALQQVRQRSDWEQAGYGSVAPTPESGCPGGKIPSVLVDRSDLTTVGPGRTKSPSPYRTAVLVLDETTAKVVLGERPATFVPFEVMCNEDDKGATVECGEVTPALVVREGFLDQPEFLDPYLTLAVGLRPTVDFARPAGENGSK